MCLTIDVAYAETSLSKLVHELEVGGAPGFVIARDGRPVAKRMPMPSRRTDRSQRLGVAKGRFKVPDDIDSANAEVLQWFEGT